MAITEIVILHDPGPADKARFVVAEFLHDDGAKEHATFQCLADEDPMARCEAQKADREAHRAASEAALAEFEAGQAARDKAISYVAAFDETTLKGDGFSDEEIAIIKGDTNKAPLSEEKL
jgi:hypothetical protein